MTKLDDAQQILQSFGFDAKRSNAIACRTLLSLAEIDEFSDWAEAKNNRSGVRGLMDFMRHNLGYDIAENSRETVRRFVLKQFVEVGFCLHNDDDIGRPTNSSKNCYRLSDQAVRVIRTFGSADWDSEIERYLENKTTQVELYRMAREENRFDIYFPSGMSVSLRKGGQNYLIKEMIEKFCPQFIDGGKILYIGDADDKYVVFEVEEFRELGVELDEHGKLPDLVVLDEKRNWLFLLEAATTHGPVDHVRYGELHRLFGASSAGLVLVSCFPDKKTLRRFITELAWETEVWVAEEPTHMLHLNGSRFLGPYGNNT